MATCATVDYRRMAEAFQGCPSNTFSGRQHAYGSSIRRRWRIIILSPLFLLAPIASLYAQDNEKPAVQIGGSASYAIGLQSGSFPVYRGFSTCGLFASGQIAALRIGGLIQWPHLFGERLGLAVGIGWSHTENRYLAYPTAEQRLIDPETRQLIELEREFHYDGAMPAVALDLMARYQLSRRFAVAFGPSIGYRFPATFEQSDNIINPPDRSFADGERSHPMLLGALFTSRPLLVGVALGTSYTIPVSPRVTLSPDLWLRGDILSSVREGAWRSITIGAGLTLLYSLPGSPPIVPTDPPAPADTLAPLPPALQGSIAIHGIDEESRETSEAVITVRTVIFRQHTPLLPAAYFDKNSATLPERYWHHQQSETKDFSLRSIAELGPFELSHHLLDLVGYRMREQPASRLKIFGLASGDEPSAMASERSRAARDYLTTVWNIPRSRMEVTTGTGPLTRSDETVEEGRSENRRIALASDAAGLLAPLATERIVREFNPPRIRLVPHIQAEAGIRRWSITIRQGERVLATFEGKGDEPFSPLRSDLLWRLSDQKIDSSPGRLRAELVVEDSAGQIIRTTDSIDLRMRGEQSIVQQGEQWQGALERLSYSLVAFGYRSAVGGQAHEERLREITDRIGDGARISITGYTDRIGDDRYNQELSLARAHYVAERIRTFTAAQGAESLELIIHGAGAETERFPNNLPEGRVLSRGATIVIEQQQGAAERPDQ